MIRSRVPNLAALLLPSLFAHSASAHPGEHRSAPIDLILHMLSQADHALPILVLLGLTGTLLARRYGQSTRRNAVNDPNR